MPGYRSTFRRQQPQQHLPAMQKPILEQMEAIITWGKQSTGIAPTHPITRVKGLNSRNNRLQIQGKRDAMVYTQMGYQRPVSSLDRFPVEERICATTKIAFTMPYVIKLFFCFVHNIFSYQHLILSPGYFLPNRPDGFKQHDDQNCRIQLHLQHERNIEALLKISITPKENSLNHYHPGIDLFTEYCRESLDTRHCACKESV